MPKAANWIILAIAVILLLAPLSEMFDSEDGLSQDGSDFAFYIICLFCLLAYAFKHTSVICAKLASLETRALLPARQYLLAMEQSIIMSYDRISFSSHVDLRI
jgi:hypothetical protein